jgi:aminopeptidase N
MDEGFTDYAENEVMYHFYKNFANKSPFISNAVKADNAKKLQEIESNIPFRHHETYDGYFRLQKSPYEEPMTTHADHFNTNYAYGLASYSKGSVFLTQLGYIVGDSVRDKILLEYYNQWKFKSPNADDFLRVAEKISGIELDWYKEYWINSTKAIDYNIGDIKYENGKTRITLKKVGKMPMPVEVLLTFKDGSAEMHYVPMNLMYGTKPAEDTAKRVMYTAWRWTHAEYVIETTRNLRDLKEVNIDPSGRMADINQTNNVLRIPD